MMDIKKIRGDIQNQINAEEVKNIIASDLNIKLDKSNKCLCFKHEEKVPSMSFDSKGKTFRCFSCGATYNIIDHYKEYHNKAYIEAIKINNAISIKGNIRTIVHIRNILHLSILNCDRNYRYVVVGKNKGNIFLCNIF